MSETADCRIGEITEEQVALYLKNHPGFFLSREDLLAELKLTHPSGKAVSLLERQVSILRERNMDMRQRLSTLMENAHGNDALFESSKKLTLQLLEAKNLDSLTAGFTRALVDNFDVDFASLTLFSEYGELAGHNSRVISVREAQEKIGSLLQNRKGVCGVLRPEDVSFLLPNDAAEVGSCAVMPIRPENPLGVIMVASRDANYFQSDMGTMFLQYLADVLTQLVPLYLDRR